jgi:hypothetical protein
MTKFPVVGIGSPPLNTQATNTAVMAVMEDVSQLLMASVYPDLSGSLFNWPPESGSLPFYQRFTERKGQFITRRELIF